MIAVIGILGFGRMGKGIYSRLKDEYEIKIIKSKDNLQDIKTLIDFSSISAYDILECAIKSKINVISGTTGYSDEQIKSLNRLALENNVIFYQCNNFAELINSFYDACKRINNKNLKIYEIHNMQKADHPSGTALYLANMLNVDVKNITSIRKYDEFAKHIVIYETQNERIVIKHEIKNKDAFIDGFINFFKRLVEEYDKRII